jgi:hypothetical protein
MRPGSITSNRHYFAALARRFPHGARLGLFLRWVYWFGYGWPLVMSAIGLTWLVVYGIPVIQLWMLVPFGALFGVAATFWSAIPKSRIGAVLLGLLAAYGVYKRDNVSAFFQIATGKIARAFVTVAGYFAAWWTLHPIVMILVHVLVPVLWVADIRLGMVMEQWWVRRQYASFRRELPVQWAILAGKSPKVQSFDTQPEDTVSEVATNRPILEAPGLWPIASYDGHTVTVRAFRTPGRGLQELLDVLDELSAQFPQVSDSTNSIELIWPDRSGSNFATTAFMRIHFKPRDYVEGFGGPGRGPGRGWKDMLRSPLSWIRSEQERASGLRPHVRPGPDPTTEPAEPFDPSWPENPAAADPTQPLWGTREAS